MQKKNKETEDLYAKLQNRIVKEGFENQRSDPIGCGVMAFDLLESLYDKREQRFWGMRNLHTSIVEVGLENAFGSSVPVDDAIPRVDDEEMKEEIVHIGASED